MFRAQDRCERVRFLEEIRDFIDEMAVHKMVSPKIAPDSKQELICMQTDIMHGHLMGWRNVKMEKEVTAEGSACLPWFECFLGLEILETEGPLVIKNEGRIFLV